MNSVSHTLRKIIEHNKLSHAYLFDSESVETLKTVAMNFASDILTQNEREIDLIHSHNHPDFYYLSTEQATIKKDDVQDLMYRMSQKPIMSNYKVYIIEAFEKLTVQAENSILKFLEEPPKNTVALLLTTDKSSILPTTLSRSQYIYVPSQMDGPLEELDYLSKNLQHIVQHYALNQSHIKELGEIFPKIVTLTTQVTELWLNEDPRALIRLKSLLELCKEQRDYALILTLFDVMMRQVMYDVLQIEYKKNFELNVSGNQVNVVQLTKNLEQIEQANKMLNFNVNSTLVFESMIISSKG